MKLAVCVLATIFVGAVNALFDCRRDPTNACKNGASCDSTNGQCTGCTAGTYEGYDCSVVVADKGHADCTTNPCLNGGTCHRAATGTTTFTCLCTENYAGATCTDKRYEVDCTTANEMSLTIRPHVDTFAGTIFLEGKHGEAACQLTQTGGTGPYQLAALSNTDATCGNTVTDGASETRKFIVRFISGTLNVQDEIVTFFCGGDTTDKTVAAVTITNVPTNVHTKDEGAGPVDADIDFTLEKSDGSPGIGNQDLGTPLTVTADLTAAGLLKFEAVRLQACKAASHTDNAAATAASETYMEKKFIDTNCKSSELMNTFVGDITRTGNAVSFTFKAFKIYTSDNVHITCTVKACATAADCNAVQCAGDTAGSPSGLGRKKREAGSVQKNLTRSYVVTDPLAVAAAKTIEEFKEAKACYQTWEMTATVVALAVALLLVLFLCLILIVKAILNRRSTATYREDVSVTNSTDHLPHLPTIVSNKA